MTTGEPVLQVDHLSVTFQGPGGDLQALDDLSFTIHLQEFVCCIGLSGSGKSVLLRTLAGLVKPTSGVVTQKRIPEGTRMRLGLVFQQANLMPWRTVLENITLPLEIEGVNLESARRQARELIQWIGLEGFETAWPKDLSGGMAQRVALARALILNPDLLLLDEPFGALDALTRERMGSELLNLWQSRQITVIMVTHSISEALLLADRVLVFSPRPGHLSLDLHVDLPRPRRDEVRFTPRFNELSRLLKRAIS